MGSRERRETAALAPDMDTQASQAPPAPLAPRALRCLWMGSVGMTTSRGITQPLKERKETEEIQAYLGSQDSPPALTSTASRMS